MDLFNGNGLFTNRIASLFDHKIESNLKTQETFEVLKMFEQRIQISMLLKTSAVQTIRIRFFFGVEYEYEF